jgi:hypothetical protein
MGEDPLASELRRVTAELAAAAEDPDSQAKVAGLKARQDALARAMAHTPRRRPDDPALGYRTDAIVAAINAAGTEMTAGQVLTALQRSGRAQETYQQVLAELAYLAVRGRIARVRPGVYAPASGEGN